MIRYHCTAQIGSEQAADLALPELQRLRTRGPWDIRGRPGALQITRGTSAAWGPERAALGGLRYQLADPLPAWGPWALQAVRPGQVPVALRNGVTVHISPVASDGMAIELDGTIGDPVAAYGQAMVAAGDLLEPGGPEVPNNHPVLVHACRLALLTGTTLTEELLHAYGLLSTADIWPILEAASGCPKAPAGAGGSPAASPASTPAA